MRQSAFFILATVILFAGCDIIEGPKKDYTYLQNQSDRVILLEEFTGHKCGSCPNGHAQTKLLKDLYPDNVVAVAIHAGGFASVGPNPFVNNYKIQMGIDLDAYFLADQAGYPKGMVNRKEHSGTALLGVADWSTWVGQEIALPVAMVIDINSALNPVDSNFSITVELEYLEEGSADDHLVVLITEDSVISPQKDYSLTPDIVTNYVHMDMLRAAVTTGTWGESVKGSAIAIGETFSRDFTFKCSPDWNPEHCHIVAYVMNNANKEVYQAAEVHATGN